MGDEPEALEDLEVAISRGDVAIAGELLGAERAVGVEGAWSSRRRAEDSRRPWARTAAKAAGAVDASIAGMR